MTNSIATITLRSSYLGGRWTGAYEQQEGLDSSFTNYCRTRYLVAIMALSQRDMRKENTVKALEAMRRNFRGGGNAGQENEVGWRDDINSC